MTKTLAANSWIKFVSEIDGKVFSLFNQGGLIIMLKNLVRVFVLAAFLIVAVQNSADAEWQNIRINNNTGQTITEVYFQPLEASDWGQNFLSGTMPDGYGLDLSYSGAGNYSFRFVFEDGSDVAWDGDNSIYLDGHSQVSIYVNGDGYYELSWQ